MKPSRRCLSPSLRTETHLSKCRLSYVNNSTPTGSDENTASSEDTGHDVSTTWGAKFFKGGSLRRQLKANVSQAKRGGDGNGHEKSKNVKM